jgi:hypothetical protein
MYIYKPFVEDAPNGVQSARFTSRHILDVYGVCVITNMIWEGC